MSGGTPFIPAWLDELPLSMLAFRIYCRISRRGDRCYDSKTKLEAEFKVSNRSLKAAFDELKSLRLIEEESRPGASSFYRPSAIQHHLPSADEHHPKDNPVLSSTTTQCQPALPPSADEHHKGTPSKELHLKNPKKEISPDGIQFASWFKTSLPDSVNLPQNWQSIFGKAFDDLVRIDTRTPEQIREVCQWARNDDFWRRNFMSPLKLRKRDPSGIQYFDVFLEKMKKPSPRAASPIQQKFKGTYEEIDIP